MPTLTTATVYCSECQRQVCGPLHNIRGYELCNNCYVRSNCFVCDECGGEFLGYDRCGSICYSCHHRLACWDTTPLQYDGKIRELKSNRRFGIELETSRCPEHHKLRKHTTYGSKFDGSIGGMEFISPILQGDRGLWATRGFCTRAKNKGFEVDSDCGYHLHIDVSDNTNIQRRHIACAYAYTESFWHSLVNNYRAYDCSYCRALRWEGDSMVTAYNFERFCDSQDRYQWFNVYSLGYHGTFEIRLHEGTLDSRLICNWVKAHLRFADFVQDMKFRQIKAMFHVPIAAMKQAVMNTWNDPALSKFYTKR